MDEFDDNRPSVVSATWLPDRVDTRSKLVREDNRAINLSTPATKLNSGQSIEVLDIREAGDIVSIKVVTDNPYTAVFLELDDWRNKEPRGETPAELLLAGRTNRADKEFYAVDNGPGGGYSMIFNPMIPPIEKKLSLS